MGQKKPQNIKVNLKLNFKIKIMHDYFDNR